MEGENVGHHDPQEKKKKSKAQIVRRNTFAITTLTLKLFNLIFNFYCNGWQKKTEISCFLGRLQL